MNIPFFPEQASTFAKDVDNIYFLLCALTFFFTALVLGLITFFAIRYRRGNNKVDRSNAPEEHLPLELTWSIIPLVLGLGVFVWSAKPFTYVYRPPADALEIFVIGKRWMWHIQHTNGIRENNELHIPVDKPIKLTMISQDVIHGFFVPAFRVKRDVLPGRYNTVWFQPTKIGRYHLYCTEYCGTNHSEMGGWVTVMAATDYQKWITTGGAPGPTSTMQETLVSQGASLYQTYACANCHQNQNGVHGPSLYGLYGKERKLTNGQTVLADDSYLRESIVQPESKIVAGYQNLMPAYPVGAEAGQLTEEQVLAMVAYIKTLGTSPAPAARAPASSGQPAHPYDGVPHTPPINGLSGTGPNGAKPADRTGTQAVPAVKPGPAPANAGLMPADGSVPQMPTFKAIPDIKSVTKQTLPAPSGSKPPAAPDVKQTSSTVTPGTAP